MTQDATVIAQMRQLIQLLAKHNHAYYVMDQPSIEDSEYDQLFHQLKALEEQYPHLQQPDTPTIKVGAGTCKICNCYACRADAVFGECVRSG